jgi:hypothetical protein
MIKIGHRGAAHTRSTMGECASILSSRRLPLYSTRRGPCAPSTVAIDARVPWRDDGATHAVPAGGGSVAGAGVGAGGVSVVSSTSRVVSSIEERFAASTTLRASSAVAERGLSGESPYTSTRTRLSIGMVDWGCGWEVSVARVNVMGMCDVS